MLVEYKKGLESKVTYALSRKNMEDTIGDGQLLIISLSTLEWMGEIKLGYKKG